MTREKVWLRLIIVVLSVLLVVMIWNDYHRWTREKPIDREEKTIHVSTEILRPETITLTQTYLGTVQAIDSVPMRPYLSGFIEKIWVKPGQVVSTGDLMFTLQQGTYLAEKEQASAKVAQAEAAFANASAYLNRIKNTASKAVSKTELDNATASFLSAEADVKAAKAALKTADVNYGYTEMRAPINGVLGRIYVTIGDYVSPQSNPLTTIVEYNPIRVSFSIPYVDYATLGSSLFQGWHIGLKLANGVDYPQSGQIQFTDNEVSAQTASVRLYADFPNPDNILLPNAFVTVHMTKKVNGMLINKGWITLTPAGDFISILKNGRIEKQPVILGPAIDNSFVVTENIPDEYVIITSQIKPSQFGRQAVSETPRSLERRN